MPKSHVITTVWIKRIHQHQRLCHRCVLLIFQCGPKFHPNLFLPLSTLLLLRPTPTNVPRRRRTKRTMHQPDVCRKKEKRTVRKNLRRRHPRVPSQQRRRRIHSRRCDVVRSNTKQRNNCLTFRFRVVLIPINTHSSIPILVPRYVPMKDVQFSKSPPLIFVLVST